MSTLENIKRSKFYCPSPHSRNARKKSAGTQFDEQLSSHPGRHPNPTAALLGRLRRPYETSRPAWAKAAVRRFCSRAAAHRASEIIVFPPSLRANPATFKVYRTRARTTKVKSRSRLPSWRHQRCSAEQWPWPETLIRCNRQRTPMGKRQRSSSAVRIPIAPYGYR